MMRCTVIHCVSSNGATHGKRRHLRIARQPRRALVVCNDFQYGPSLAALERVIKASGASVPRRAAHNTPAQTINTIVTRAPSHHTASTQTKTIRCTADVRSRAHVGTAVSDAATKLSDSPIDNATPAALLQPHPTLMPGCLLQYLLLPVDQYVLLDDGLVTRRDDGLFSISLPMKQVTGLNLHPVAVLRVEQQAEAVRFVVQELRMGNAAMDSMFDVEVTLTMSAPRVAKGLAAEAAVVDAVEAAQQPWVAGQVVETQVRLQLQAQVHGRLSVIPAPLLSTVVGLVFRALVTAMAPSLLQLLVQDYARWAVGLPRSDQGSGHGLQRTDSKGIKQRQSTPGTSMDDKGK